MLNRLEDPCSGFGSVNLKNHIFDPDTNTPRTYLPITNEPWINLTTLSE